MNNMAKIILLNGPSNSGKSELAKELQRLLPEPFLTIGLEEFMQMVPESYSVIGSNCKEGFYLEEHESKDGSNAYLYKAGLFGKRVIGGMFQASLALAKQGINLIIDDVCYGKDQVQHYKDLFIDYDLYIVGIKSSIQEIKKREKTNNVSKSTAEKELEIVHKEVKYDYEVDLSKQTLESAAKSISQLMFNNKKNTA